MSVMKAKMRVTGVEAHGDSQTVHFVAVSKSDGYGDDGADENNTYAQYTPSADAEFLIQNPALMGKFEIDQEFYVDFTAVK